MAGRWRDPAAFRADPSTAPAARPSRRQSTALIAVLVLAAGAISAASYLIQPDKAQSFDLFHGSVFLGDSLAPVAVDLASGRPTVRLIEANNQVGAKDANNLAVTPVQGGTLLLNRSTGEFNMVDSTGFVIKTNGGVPLPKRAGATGAVGIASGQLAYIEQTGPTGTSVYLVSESTVQTAKIRPNVAPRAFRSMSEPGSTAPGSAASTGDNDLWLLLERNGRHVIRQLTLPANSRPGATLTSTDHGTVGGTAAIGTATVDDGGAGASVVGVASDDRIQLFRDGRSAGTVKYQAQSGIDTILPASNAEGRLSFLMHGPDGWSVVSVGADGSGLRGPTKLTGVAPGSKLIAPAASRDRLYTMDTSGGQFVQIDSAGQASGIPGAGSYPLAERNGKAIEPGGFGDAYAIARGSRVIFNSPVHSDAMVLFTDGSHPPMSIVKSSAVSVNASGGAEALTKTQNNLGQPSKDAGTKPKAIDPISNKINCKTATQKPHIPTIGQPQPGSRSVGLSWTYPLLDPQDCEPSTYTVNVKLVSSAAPSPPSSVKVQGQKSVNLAGLFPSTQYEISVTAYINGQGTTSAPIRVTTGPEGPAAPKNVKVRAGSDGNWNITWTTCGGVKQDCVPAATWKVIPQFCDGRGLSGAPDPIVVTADPTTSTQPPAQLKGGDALLGRGLRFQVEGTGEANTVGNPSSDSPCVYSWRRPVASDISVEASTPPTTTGQGTTSTNVSVRFARDDVHDLGGVGGQLTYRLLDSNGSVVTKQGPTTETSVRLAGIRAGQRYTVAVTAQPPRHPESSVTLPAVAVQGAIAVWPTPALTVGFTNTSPSAGRLSVSFDFPAGTDTHGETFDLVNTSLDCGSSTFGLNDRNGISPGQTMTFVGIDRLTYHGTCSVSLQLAQNQGSQTDPPLYGSSNSPRASSSLTISEPTAGSSPQDFQAQWSGDTSNPQIVVTYHGGDRLLFSSNWTITATNGTTTDCGTTHDSPTATITVDKACIKQGGSFTVSVDYHYFLSHPSFNGIPVNGTAPQPVDPSKISFGVSWSGTASNPTVDVNYTGSQDPSSFGSLTWTETVTSSSNGGIGCDPSSDSVPGRTDIFIRVNTTTCPPTNTDGTPAVYSIEIQFSDPNYGKTGDYKYNLTGSPPN